MDKQEIKEITGKGLHIGQTVTVYEDPVTCKKLEGTAEVRTIHGWNNRNAGLVRATVRFYGYNFEGEDFDAIHFLRILNIRHLNDDTKSEKLSPDLRYKPKEIDWKNDYLSAMKRNMARLQEIDTTQKKAGTLVGRYIQEAHADGYAYYQITSARDDKVTIVVCTGLGDDWTIPYWAKLATIDRSYAEKSICFRDRLEQFFLEKAKS